MRSIIPLLLLAFAAVITLPFVLSSYYIDLRGITIPGKVFSKREDVLMRHGKPTLESEVSVEYDKPDGSGAGFLKVTQAPDFDHLHVGQPVSLHYLRSQDVPAVPFAAGLRKMQLLPTVRRANQRMFSGGSVNRNVDNSALPWVVLAGAVLLLFWGLFRLPGFIWIAFCCLLVVAAIGSYEDFPRPTPAPIGDVRQTTATVKSLDRISKLFQSTHSRGVFADMPIEVVGLQFTPHNQTDPIVALDLIDAGSSAGLREKGLVPVAYQADTPRIAHIQNASRTFVPRNLAGIVMQGVYVLVLCAALLLGAWLLKSGYRRLTSNSSSRTN